MADQNSSTSEAPIIPSPACDEPEAPTGASQQEKGAHARSRQKGRTLNRRQRAKPRGPSTEDVQRNELCPIEEDKPTTIPPMTDTVWSLTENSNLLDDVDLERLFTTLQDDGLFPLDQSTGQEAKEQDEILGYSDGDFSLYPTKLAGHSSLSSHDVENMEPSSTDKETPETASSDSAIQSTSLVKIAKRESILFVFYNFISIDIPTVSSPHTAMALEEGGCFHLPSSVVMDDFMKQYFLYVHPFMPVIDEGDFWEKYALRQKGFHEAKGYSLFVVQAMLFMACPFVSEGTLALLGFTSVRQARAAFFSRAKALFESNYCQDDIAKAQGAIMLTYHTNHPNELASTHWMDTALHFARKAGVHRAQDATVSRTPRMLHLRNRLWWCCVLRDTIMSLGLRRRFCLEPLPDRSHPQPALTEDDFEDEIWNSHVCKPDEKQVLVRLFLRLCKLGTILKEALGLLYGPKDDDVLIAKPRAARDCRAAKLVMAKLDSWCESVQSSLQLPSSSYNDHQDSIKLLHNAIYIYYHSARTSLLNHMILVSVGECGFGDEEQYVTQHWVQTELNKSFRGVTRSLTELQQRGLALYLPNTFIAFSAFSFVWYTLGAEVTRTRVRSSTQMMAGLRTIVILMNAFRNLYENVDHVFQCMERLVGFARAAKIVDTLFPSQDGRQISKAPGSSQIDLATRSPMESHVVTESQDTADSHRYYLWLALSLDYSLSHGDLPNVVNLPRCLQKNAKDILTA